MYINLVINIQMYIKYMTSIRVINDYWLDIMNEMLDLDSL